MAILPDDIGSQHRRAFALAYRRVRSRCLPDWNFTGLMQKPQPMRQMRI
jgi:hypothetical protein